MYFNFNFQTLIYKEIRTMIFYCYYCKNQSYSFTIKIPYLTIYNWNNLALVKNSIDVFF